jgi:hypothetical protein
MINLQLTEQQIQIILQALVEIPLKFSGPVFTALQNQLIKKEE